MTWSEGRGFLIDDRKPALFVIIDEADTYSANNRIIFAKRVFSTNREKRTIKYDDIRFHLALNSRSI